MTSKSDKDEKEGDWSGRHVRLSYQMFLTTVLLFLVSNYKVSGLNIFGVFKFENPPTQEILFWVVFFIACYAVISFLTQTVVEFSRQPNNINAAITLLKVQSSKIGKIKKLSNEFNNSISMTNIRKIYKESESPTKISTDHIYPIFSENLERLQEIYRSIGSMKENNRTIEEIASGVGNGYHEPLVLYHNALIDLGTTSDKVLTNVNQIGVKIESQAAINRNASSNLLLVLDASESLSIFSNSVFTNLNSIISRFNRFKFLYLFHRGFLSVFLPSLVSFCLIGLALFRWCSAV